MTDRPKLSLGSTTEKTDKTAAWSVSEKRKDALHDRARYNRRHPLEAHKRLWALLDNKGVGNFAFNREVVMGSALVDFACKTRWLVVEITGPSEADATIAELTDRKLRDVGVRVLRFTEEQIMGDLAPVEVAILYELQQPFEKPGRQRPERRPERPDDSTFHRSRY